MENKGFKSICTAFLEMGVLNFRKEYSSQTEYTQEGRNVSIDVIKGIGIILMVAGHCGAPFTNFIYLFHMAIFFMASGYCFKTSNSDTIQDVIKFTGRKFKGLWFPYVLWTTIYSLCHNLFIKLNIYTSDADMLKYVSGDLINITQPWSITTMLKNIMKSFLLHGHTQLGSAFWFLATLMEISWLYCLIDFLGKKVLKKKGKQIFLQGIVSLVMLFLGYRCSLTNTYLGGRVLSFYCLFFIGYLLKAKNIMREVGRFSHYVKIVCSFVILVICNHMGSIALDQNQYENLLFLLMTSLSGWVLVYELAQEIQKFKGFCGLIVCCGQNSMAIIILHFLCFKVVSFIGVLVEHQPRGLIAAFPVLFQDGLWWIAYMIVGVMPPVLLNLLWKIIKKNAQNSYNWSNYG